MFIRLNKSTVACTLCALTLFALYFLLLLSDHNSSVELFINEQLHNGRRKTGSKQPEVTVFVAVEKSADLVTEYRLAHRTLKCYCSMNNYPLVVIELFEYRQDCPQKDFMFRRHCALARWLADHPHAEWVLFLDADMAVINPNHAVEDYLPLGNDQNAVDLVFYERLFNGEIAAGSYLARNTNFTRQFLMYWTNYGPKLPWSWHGTDNGAIHAVFLDHFCGDQCSERRSVCWALWRAARDDDGLRMFTDCARAVLGKRNAWRDARGGRVQLRTNFRDKFWARDGWLSGDKWCARDFILHGWKKKWQNSTNWGGWRSPLSVDEDRLDQILSPEKCSSPHKPPKWPHNPAYAVSTRAVDALLQARLHETRITQLDYWRRIEEYAEQRGKL